MQNSQKNISKLNTSMHKKNNTPWPNGFYSTYAKLTWYFLKINVIHNINRLKMENMLILIDAEKTLDKNPIAIYDKNSE